jgi:hypothetical protein
MNVDETLRTAAVDCFEWLSEKGITLDFVGWHKDTNLGSLVIGTPAGTDARKIPLAFHHPTGTYRLKVVRPGDPG